MIKLPASRILISIILLLLFFGLLIAVLFVTNLSFSVWEQLQHKPDWLILGYFLGIVLISLMFGRIIWRLLFPKKTASKQAKSRKQNNNMEATLQRVDTLSQKILENTKLTPVQEAKSAHSKADGRKEKTALNTVNSPNPVLEIDQKLNAQWDNDFTTSAEFNAIKAELEDYAQRTEQQTLYIALFGNISSGKSSVIKALIADAHSFQQNYSEKDKLSQETITIETSVVGGTTREIKHYRWSIENDGVEEVYHLTDMPGMNEQYAEQDLLATEEALRAHIVIYLCDGDLTASQFDEFKALLLLEKPCIIALNKADCYSQEELQLIVEKIKQRVINIAPALEQKVPVLTINAGGLREFIRLTPDGEEQRVQRPVPPDISLLKQQLLKMMQSYGVDHLEQLREKSVAQMVNHKLDDIEAGFRLSRSQRMVSSYTKKAVVASMAAISPGTDILIQGYLGIQMIKDLCQLYEVGATDIDANKLIELIQSRMDKTLPLLLAIAGNGLKAFPGVGTVSGGLMHAVAYGMIFDTLGHSVVRTLEVTGELSPTLISDLYKEQLGENIESRTKDFIKLVLKFRNSN